jgi:hypothetical protein
MRADDLAPLFARRRSDEIGFRQGTVIAWDASSGTNQINVAGAVLDDLPILGGLEATTVEAGDIVGVVRIRSQFFVLGHIARPDLASNVTVQVDGARVPLVQLAGGTQAETATNDVVFNTDTGGWVPVSQGPAVGNVEVYTGRLLVMMTAHAVVQDIASVYFGHRLTGPQTVEPLETRSAFLRGQINTSVVGNIMFAHMHTGLTPGTYTIAARVLTTDVQELPGINDVLLGARTLIAIPY